MFLNKVSYAQQGCVWLKNNTFLLFHFKIAALLKYFNKWLNCLEYLILISQPLLLLLNVRSEL